ncbi:hypothetical protein Riv7116_2213 [Rivularia sp. PCC 7116]|uniref:hypothetical protein n=1 Tax=Rivularia sp. PCC 7116 TaxID=373994 RepID=UPI00029F1AB1|nr:hypothetical protein [Rivularia sp. PCC 7116]AFY54736.1 hypothetical protein Riv7116_2213 [Rivularia sp. PCC 7116]
MYKRLLLIFSLISGCVGIATFVVWQQAMQLPEWYIQSGATEKVISSTEQVKTANAEEVLRKVSDNLTAKTTGEVELDAEEVNSLIISSIEKKDNTKKFATAIKGTNTKIQNGKISVGAVVETSSIPIQDLSGRNKTKIIQLLQRLPGKEKRVYIGIEGKPSIRNQEFSFDDTTRVSLGYFSFPIAEVSQNIGIPQDSINRLLSQEIKKLPIKLESINVQGERVVIRGSRNQ